MPRVNDSFLYINGMIAYAGATGLAVNDLRQMSRAHIDFMWL